jgi:hypothetical protein
MRFTILLAATLFAGCAPMVDTGDSEVAADAANTGDAVTAADSMPSTVDASTDPTAPTFTNVRAIVAANCTGYCHFGSNQQNAVNFADGDWSMSNVLVASTQVPRLRVVEPGDPDRSYLVHKIEGTMSSLDECRADARRCGLPMPYDTQHRVTLPAGDRALIRAWIAAGAPSE